jgi:hypothetical protein
LREDAQKLKEEKTAQEEMIQSHDELIMEMAEEYGLNCMEENDDDEDEDDGDEGNAIAPPAPAPTPIVVPEEIIKQGAPMEMVPEQEAPVAHEVVLADAKPKPPQPCLFNMIIRDYEESLPRMENGPPERDDLVRSDMDEWFSKDGSNNRD